MAVDINLLQILKYRNEYQKVINRVPEESIDKVTKVLLDDFGKYFDKFPDHDRIHMQTFATMFNSWHPKLKKEQKEEYALVLRKAHKDLPKNEHSVVLQTLLELRLSSDIAHVLTKYDLGEISNIHGELDQVLTYFRSDAKIKGLDFVEVDVDELLARETNDDGLRWRLSCLNASMRGLRDGDFGIVAGRPDKGKTTFMASEITELAKQSDRQIIWLNNEGPGDRIYPRLWQAALGCTMSEVIAKNKEGILKRDYMEAINAKEFYKIKVIDIHGQDTYAVERILEHYSPSLVVYDMIDNIRGFGGEARTDLALEAMYKWARELGVKYQCAGIATSQLSVDASNVQFPADHMLKDSKTGKQGACDFIITIGAVDDPGFVNSRFIGVPKNKLRREGGDTDPKERVNYKPAIARYEDIKVEDND